MENRFMMRGSQLPSQSRTLVAITTFFGLLAVSALITPAWAQSLYPGNATPLAPSSITNVPATTNGIPSSSITPYSNGLSNGAIGPTIDSRSGATNYSGTGYSSDQNGTTSGNTTPSTLNNGVTNPDTGLNYGQSSTTTNQPSAGTLGYGNPILSGPPSAGSNSGGNQSVAPGAAGSSTGGAGASQGGSQ